MSARVIFFVAASLEHGVAEARGKSDWTQIAYARFVTPDRDDIRVISRAAELVPMPGGTPMIKGGDYEEGPPVGLESWIRQKDDFDRFVAEGNGEWIDAP